MSTKSCITRYILSLYESYLFSIENVDDVREYLFQLLDNGSDNVRDFVDEICNYWQPFQSQKAKPLSGKDKTKVC